MKINRSDIKHNFLKQILFRLDFNGILDTDVEKCVVEIRQMLIDNHYLNYNDRFENQVDFQLREDLAITNENPFAINSMDKTKVYNFTSEDKEVIELSKKFLTLTVEINENYTTFDKYIKLIEIIILKLKKVSPYFKALRLGLRKINICFLKNLYDIPSYFNETVINARLLANTLVDYKYKASNFSNIFERDMYKINFARNIQEGIMQTNDTERILYQIALDADIYIDDILNLSETLEEESKLHSVLVNANSFLFDIYINSLSSDFIDCLKEEVFKDTNIEGVI